MDKKQHVQEEPAPFKIGDTAIIGSTKDTWVVASNLEVGDQVIIFDIDSGLVRVISTPKLLGLSNRRDNMSYWFSIDALKRPTKKAYYIQNMKI